MQTRSARDLLKGKHALKVNRVSHVARWHKCKARRSRKCLCFCALEGAFRSGCHRGTFLAGKVMACSGSETILPGRGEAISCSSISGTCVWFLLVFFFFNTVFNNDES